LTRKGIWMDPDLNKYDLNHRVTHHQKMSDEEWDQVYNEVWDRFYTFEHMETILRRMTALGSNKRLTTVYRLLWYRDFRRFHGCHPLEGGFFRVKVRRDRRSGMAIENPVSFYAKYAVTETRNLLGMGWDYIKLRRAMQRIWTDPKRFDYRDQAITPPAADCRGVGGGPPGFALAPGNAGSWSISSCAPFLLSVCIARRSMTDEQADESRRRHRMGGLAQQS
jgi:hypothetical protein